MPSYWYDHPDLPHRLHPHAVIIADDLADAWMRIKAKVLTTLRAEGSTESDAVITAQITVEEEA